MAENKLTWQSKLVLLAVLPFAGTEVVLDCNWWASHEAAVVIWTIGLSILLGLVTWWLRAATPAAALTGVLITAHMMEPAPRPSALGLGVPHAFDGVIERHVFHRCGSL